MNILKANKQIEQLNACIKNKQEFLPLQRLYINPDQKIDFQHEILNEEQEIALKLQNINPDFKLETYFGAELTALPEAILIKIAECYKTVFNESWQEAWTIDSALSEVRNSFQFSQNRIPLASLIFYKEEAIGFAWGALLDANDLIPEKDMPFSLALDKKQVGVKIVQYFLKNVVKRDKVLLLKECGILKKYRNKSLPFLYYSLNKYAVNNGCFVNLLWTNIRSKAFDWGIGLGGSPFHFFLEDDLLLLQGNIKDSLNIICTIINTQNYKLVVNNIHHYLCK